VLRQSSLTSVIALVAVLSGLGLDLCIAAAFGAGADTDAFVVAARLPLGLSAVVMVMANQVLVPGFTTWASTLPASTRRRVETATLLGVIGAVVLVAAVIALAAAPLAQVMAPGFEDGQTALAARLMRVMVWYLPCVAGAEVLRCWLNSRMSFAVPAAMTMVLNVVAVAAHARGVKADFDHLVRLGLRIMLFVAVPMGVLGAVLAPDTTSLVFGVGRFDERSVALLGSVLAIYALSFPGSGVQRALLAPFFALRDTKTPWRNSLYGALTNVALLPLLVLPFGRASTAMYGVAFAYTAAHCVNVAHGWWRLRRTVDTDLSPVRADLLRSALGATLAGLAAAAVLTLVPVASGKPALAAQVLAATLAGLLVYGAALLTDRRVRVVLGRQLPRRLSVRRSGPRNGTAAVTLEPKPPTEDHHVSRR